MKETVASPPSNTRHQKENSGIGKQFFPRGQEDSFFKSTGIQAKLSVGQRGDKYEQQADAMAEKLISKKANNTPVTQATAIDRATDEKLDKKEEEQKQEEVNTLQRKPMFESDGEPDVQRSMYPEVDEGERVFRSEKDPMTGKMSMGDTIVSIARSKLGKVKAKEGLSSEGGKPLRYGHETLLEIFHLAAPGVWDDQAIKYLAPNTLPSWCGIFAVYCIKKAGIDIGNWQMGRGVSSFGKLKQTQSPQAGDIGYMDLHQHHAIIVKVEGDIVHSIDGNSGLQSEIIENKRPLKAYRGFFTALHNEVSGAVQKKENSGTGNEASPSIENKINASKGSGSPLDSSTRTEMENGFGHDFSGVRVHTDSEAQQMNKNLNAQAFTHGQDIYFDEGKYNPGTTSGKHLLAHELTHTVQQTGAIGRKMVQRAPGTKKASSAKDPVLDSSVSPKAIVFPEIQLPAFKEFSKTHIGEPLERVAGYKRKDAYEIQEGDETEERKKPQSILWMDSVRTDVKSIVEKKTKANNAVSKAINGKTVYFFKQTFGKGGSQNLFGTVDDLVENSIIPKWTKNGLASAFDVDHVKELQLGGQNEMTNMELVQFSANRSSGAAIATHIESKVAEVITLKKIKDKASDEEVEIKGDVDAIKKKYSLRFTKVKYNLGGYKKDENLRWTEKEIKAGDQLKNLKPLKDLKDLNGKKGDEIIYTSEIGGKAIKISKLEKLAKKGDSIKLSKGAFKEHENAATGDEIGTLKAEFGSYGSKLTPKDIVIPIYKMDGVIHGGGIKRKGQSGKGGLEQLIVGLDLVGMSPIKVDVADIDEKNGLYARGRIVPTLSIIKGVEIDFYIDKDEIRLSKTFVSGDLSDKFPKPFVVNHAAITVSMGNKGFKVDGDVFFEIQGVGTGQISGTAKDDGSFGIAGTFDFDPKLFKGKVSKAGVKAAYDRENGWKIEGDLEVQKDSVKGIKTGNIHVEYANEVLKAEGTAETTIKGVKEVTLKIVFGKEVFEIEGGVKIEKLPGIKEGEGTLKIAKKDSVYDFSGSGKITPDIPGIDSKVDFAFVNDIFTVDASMQYKRDRLEGKLQLGITNQELVEGVPTGKKSEEYTVFGGGQLSLKITDDLKVTAGVKLLPNGEVEVVGRIDLPKRFNLFPAPMPKRKKQLLRVPVSVPTPIPVIQIYVYGYIDAEGEIGGGYLSDVFAEVKYNPSHPEDMKITGGMSFNMPAYAEIKAGVEFGVKASLLIASIRGGIDLSAALRLDVPQPLLKGELSWSPANGFELDGVAKIGIMPSLKFTGAFKITGEVDLLVKTLSKSWSWPFASMTLAPDAPFGMEFPFKYNKNTPLNLSFDQIKFTYPSVSQLAGSLKDSVVNEIDSYLG